MSKAPTQNQINQVCWNIFEDDFESVKEFIKKFPKAANAPSDCFETFFDGPTYSSPMHAALEQQNFQIAAFLLKHGGTIKIGDISTGGVTAHQALEWQQWLADEMKAQQSPLAREFYGVAPKVEALGRKIAPKARKEEKQHDEYVAHVRRKLTA